jgi:hypothetical protein
MALNAWITSTNILSLNVFDPLNFSSLCVLGRMLQGGNVTEITVFRDQRHLKNPGYQWLHTKLLIFTFYVLP